MAKTFGSIHYVKQSKRWHITALAPQVCIKLKSIFSQLRTSSTVPFHFIHSPEVCSDLLWFINRYPLQISDTDLKKLKNFDLQYRKTLNEISELFLPDYHPKPVSFKGTEHPRNYQLVANDFLLMVNRYLLGDDLGLGKTVTGILGFLNPGALPAAVVCNTHLTHHWQFQIEKFTNLRVHVIKSVKSYPIPKDIDVCIYTYSKLRGWTDSFNGGYFKYAVFDEVQDLRNPTTDKYIAGKNLSKNARYVVGMTATPIFIKALNIFYILDLIKKNSLGLVDDFCREWGYNVNDRHALGCHLRDSNLFLRRSRADVNMEMPPVNNIIYDIEYDEAAVEKEIDLLKQLAMVIQTGSFMERGEASRTFDIRMRQITGVSKAKYVAAFVKIILDAEDPEPVVLFGWHREVYEIWKEELAEYNPHFYTGTESPKQKNESKEAFVSGATKLLIMSLGSGAGLDGLQATGSIAVFGELDWSPEIHRQCIGRLNRPGQTKPVTAYFLTSNDGSDPGMIERLASIASMSHNIIDPFTPIPDKFTDESHIKKLAEYILHKRKKDVLESDLEKAVEKEDYERAAVIRDQINDQ